MRKNVLFVLLFAVTCLVGNAQGYTTLGIGINPPLGTLQIHSATPEQPTLPLDPPRDIGDYYRTTLLMTNGNSGAANTDGFIIEQDDLKVRLKQQENDELSIENSLAKIILTPSGRVGIGALGEGTNKFNVDCPMRVNGALRLESSISMAGGININNGSISLNSNGSAVFANQVQIGNGFLCSIDGLLKVKEVKVTMQDWPDYVFDNSYGLMPLGEVERYIAVHRHLPEVPSAAEVEENGVDVGEMNKLLLQKVEELTLYVIDLQKQIDELKSNQ